MWTAVEAGMGQLKEIMEPNGSDMKSFDTSDSINSEKANALMRDRWWPQMAKREGILYFSRL